MLLFHDFGGKGGPPLRARALGVEARHGPTGRQKRLIPFATGSTHARDRDRRVMVDMAGWFVLRVYHARLSGPAGAHYGVWVCAVHRLDTTRGAVDFAPYRPGIAHGNPP